MEPEEGVVFDITDGSSETFLALGHSVSEEQFREQVVDRYPESAAVIEAKPVRREWWVHSPNVAISRTLSGERWEQAARGALGAQPVTAMTFHVRDA